MINITEEEIRQIISDLHDLQEGIFRLTKGDKFEDLKNKKYIYRRIYAPKVTELIRRSEIIIGEDNPEIKDAKEKQRIADIDYSNMRKMVDSLSLIGLELVLRQK